MPKQVAVINNIEDCLNYVTKQAEKVSLA